MTYLFYKKKAHERPIFTWTISKWFCLLESGVPFRCVLYTYKEKFNNSYVKYFLSAAYVTMIYRPDKEFVCRPSIKITGRSRSGVITAVNSRTSLCFGKRLRGQLWEYRRSKARRQYKDISKEETQWAECIRSFLRPLRPAAIVSPGRALIHSCMYLYRTRSLSTRRHRLSTIATVYIRVTLFSFISFLYLTAVLHNGGCAPLKNDRSVV